jgi:hypothetical protein
MVGERIVTDTSRPARTREAMILAVFGFGFVPPILAEGPLAAYLRAFVVREPASLRSGRRPGKEGGDLEATDA